MTTPDTSAVRAWARDNGYDVADRGRLPAEVTAAYLAAKGGGSPRTATRAKAPAAKKAAPQKKAAQKKAAPARKAAPAKKPVARAAVQNVAAAQAAPAREAAPAEAPQPKPSVVGDDRRLVALGEEIKALTQRVAALEKTSGGSKSGTGKATRFRRRS